MEVLRLVRSSKVSLLAIYCFVIVVAMFISSIKSSPIPQDAGGFQKPHFQVKKNFRHENWTSDPNGTREIVRD